MLGILDLEVREFALNATTINEKQHADRAKALQLLSHTVEALWPSATVSVYGSSAMNLALPHSDMDVLVHGDFGHAGDEKVLPYMRALCHKLEQCEGWVLQATLREKTRVPVIRLSIKTEVHTVPTTLVSHFPPSQNLTLILTLTPLPDFGATCRMEGGLLATPDTKEARLEEKGVPPSTAPAPTRGEGSVGSCLDPSVRANAPRQEEEEAGEAGEAVTDPGQMQIDVTFTREAEPKAMLALGSPCEWGS